MHTENIYMQQQLPSNQGHQPNMRRLYGKNGCCRINYNNSDNGRVRVDRYFYMYTFKGATQCNTIIIPVRMSLIPAYHRAEKCQSAKPVLGATLQTAKSRTMAVVTQATTAIIFSIKFKLCTSNIKTACYRMTK